jgi:GTP-binding protein
LDPSRFPRSPWPEVAVSGRSNVGKSSLLNVLFGRRNFARISKDPGKTRSINFYAVNDRFYLVDLPGYGYARVSAESRANWMRVVERYVADRPALAGVAQLIDSRREPSPDDRRIIERLIASRRQFLVVFTKADKISRAERPRVLRAFHESFEKLALVLPHANTRPEGDTGSDSSALRVPALFFSSETGEGKEELWGWISALVEVAHAPS